MQIDQIAILYHIATIETKVLYVFKYHNEIGF